jgi:WD40 repeat protein
LATLEHHNHAIDKLLDKDVIRLWDLATGTEKHQLAARPKRWYMNLRFAPDGKKLLAQTSSGIGGELTLWDVETGKRLREMPDANGQVMAVSPDGERLACGVANGKFEVFDLKDGRRLSPGHGWDTLSNSVVLSSDGARATTFGWRSAITWDLSTNRRLRSLELSASGFTGPCPSPDGRYLVTNRVADLEVSEIQLWDAVAGKLLHVLVRPGKQTYHYTCAFAPNSSTVACVLSSKETAVHLFDVRTGKETSSFKVPKVGWPWNLFFTPDGKTLLIAGMSKMAGVDVASGKELFAWRMEPLPDNSGIRVAPAGGAPAVEQERAAWRKLVVSPTGTVAACFLSGGFSREPIKDRLILCDAHSGRVIHRWSDSGIPTNDYEKLAFSADGRLLASSDDGHLIHLWEVATAKKLRTFRGHRGEIRSLAFSADGKRLASSSTDSTVLVWDLVPAVPTSKVDDAAFASLWSDLAGDDAPRAYAAIWQLASAGDAAVNFLRQKIHAVPVPDQDKIRQLIDDLDSETFAVRENAHKTLEELGAVALPVLREALEKNPSAERRRHVEKLLQRQPDLLISPKELRQLRALHALEQIGSPATQQLLQHLAEGAPAARLTREAKAALNRLAKR